MINVSYNFLNHTFFTIKFLEVKMADINTPTFHIILDNLSHRKDSYFVCACVCVCFYLSINLSTFMYLSLCMSMYLLMYMRIRVCIYLSIDQSIHLSVFMCSSSYARARARVLNNLSVYLGICLCVYENRTESSKPHPERRLLLNIFVIVKLLYNYFYKT